MTEHVPPPRGEPLQIWVVYDHPVDFPSNYVARQFLNEKPTRNLIISPDIEAIREQLEIRGLFRLPRDPTDDPKIVECWL